MVRKIMFAIAIMMMLLVPASVADAAPAQSGQGGAVASPAPPMQFVLGPRDNPTAIPHTDVWDPYIIYNDRLVPPPVSSIEADIADGGRSREASGRGIYQNNVEGNEEMHTHAVRIDGRDAARGMTLYPQSHVCNNFNTDAYWATLGKRPPVDAGRALADVWSDWYGGWGPFAVDDGYYKAKNTTFSLERNVGPGENFDSGYSIKIASNQPYAGGFGSPMIKVTPGAQVTVKVNYLLWDHDFKGLDYDWASMGVKADAEAAPARYVNGYTRGHWSQLENTVTAGPSGYIMVLLQGHSPAALNSNIYFDDVRIQVNGEYMANCTWASETE